MRIQSSKTSQRASWERSKRFQLDGILQSENIFKPALGLGLTNCRLDTITKAKETV